MGRERGNKLEPSTWSSFTPSTFHDSQRVIAAPSFLSSNPVPVFLLASSHIEPHEKGDAGK